jgi:DNA replication protein DnaC
MMPSMTVHQQLAEYLKALRLTSMRDSFVEIAERASQESLGYDQYLLELVRHEWETRQNRRIARLLRESGLPYEKTLETFDLNRLPAQVLQAVTLMKQGFFLEKAENVLAFGNPGTGKTHLLCGVAQHLVRQGHRLWFTTCSLLVQHLLRAKRELTLGAYLKKLHKFEAIVIDDIGYVQHDREEMEVLFTLLADRYERRSVMITSNLPFSKWETIFKDPMTTAAAIDRVVHHSVIVELNLPSYRMEEAQKDTHTKQHSEKNRDTETGNN